MCGYKCNNHTCIQKHLPGHIAWNGHQALNGQWIQKHGKTRGRKLEWKERLNDTFRGARLITCCQ